MTGLNKQTLSVNFGNGLDTKTDPKLVMPGTLTTLKNGVYQKRNRIDKRFGYDALPTKDLNGNIIPPAMGLATFKEELLQYAGQRLYSLSESVNAWVDKGPLVSSIVKTHTVVNNTFQQSKIDSAIINGVGVYAYLDSRGGLWASLFDETTNTALLNDVQLNATATSIRCLAFNNYLYVFYFDTNAVKVRRASPNNPTLFESAVTLITDIDPAHPHFDVVAINNVRMYMVYNRLSSAGVVTLFVDGDLNVLGGALTSSTLSTEPATNSLYLIPGAKQIYCVAYHNGTNGVRAVVTNSGATIFSGPTTIDSYTSTPVPNIAGYPKRGTTNFQLFYEISNATVSNTLIGQNTLTVAGTAGTPSVFLRSVGLLTRAWFYNDPNDTVERGYVGIWHDSTLQSTNFVARNDGYLCAKILPGIAGGQVDGLQNVSNTSGQIYSFGVLNKRRLTTEHLALFSLTGASKTQINMSSLDSFNTAELGQNLLICGGILSAYDGVSAVEQGFNLFPEDIASSLVPAGSGLPDGIYQYAITYEWQDNYGNIIRSAGSVPFEVNATGGPNNVVLTIPTLRLTQKTGNRTNVTIGVYRTQANQTVLFRASSIVAPTFNDPTIDFITYVDALQDSFLIANDPLYTTGGELDNEAPPSCSYIAIFKNRVFLAGLEDENLAWYSKIVAQGSPVNFAAELTQLVDPLGGPLTAVGVLDDKVIFFKADRFYLTYGDGPDNTGQNGTFAQPQFVTTDAGCIAFRSIVRMPLGLMFQSEKGIYLLNSSLSLAYIGAEVEEFNALNVSSASLKAELNQVRFITSDGDALIYDYYFQKWSTFTNHQGLASVIWNSGFIYLRTDGQIFSENQAVFTDAGVSYSLGLITGWFALDNVTGFQRIYALQFLGEYKSDHILRVKVGYDFSEAYLNTILFVPKTAIPETVYGDDPTYGAISPYGNVNNAYRFKASMSTQKCQAIRFLIEDVISSATDGTKESLNISSIGLLVGIKGRLGRMPLGQSIGAQGVTS